VAQHSLRSEKLNGRPELNINDRRVRFVLRALQRQPWLRPGKLADMVQLSRSYLGRLVKSTKGVGMAQCSMELRLQRARHLLRTTFHSVKEVCAKAGFRDDSNFSHYFKRRFGVSPSAYRRSLKRVLTKK
jgi:transcriptional regulator GlxA family with amidase domain